MTYMLAEIKKKCGVDLYETTLLTHVEKLYTKHPRWCSKHNIYKYSQSQPTHLVYLYGN
jgi:hypothetical protein